MLRNMVSQNPATEFHAGAIFRWFGVRMNSHKARNQAGCEQEHSCLRLQGRNLRNNIVIRVGACSRHWACYSCLCRENARLWVHPCLWGKMQERLGETIFAENQGPDTSVSPSALGLVGPITSSLKSSRVVSLLHYVVMTHGQCLTMSHQGTQAHRARTTAPSGDPRRPKGFRVISSWK